MPSGGGLGIRAGEIWAYRAGQRTPLQPAKIIDPGEHYDASIRIRLVDDPGHAEKWVTRVKLPCQWHEAGAWLDQHPEAWPIEYAEPLPQPAAVDRVTITVAALRRVVRQEIAAVIREGRLAYSYEEAAAAVGLSPSSLQAAVRHFDLVPSYYGSKPLFRVEELKRWLETLPDEPR